MPHGHEFFAHLSVSSGGIQTCRRPEEVVFSCYVPVSHLDSLKSGLRVATCFKARKNVSNFVLLK